MENAIALIISKYIDKEELANTALDILKRNSFEVELLEEEKIKSVSDISKFAVVIHCLGSYCYDEAMGVYDDYVRAGGYLIFLSGNPFSIPYYIEEGKLKDLKECNKGIRILELVDSFLEVELPNDKLKLQVVKGELINETEFIDEITKVWSGLYHLSKKDSEGNLDKKAILTPMVALQNQEGNNIAMPISEIRLKQGGAVCFFSWENSTGNILESDLTKKLLVKLCTRAAFMEGVVEAKMEYAMYFPSETPKLNINYVGKRKGEKTKYKLAVYRVDEDSDLLLYTEEEFFKNSSVAKSINVCHEGRYRVCVEIYCENTLVEMISTGFYYMSLDEIKKRTAVFEKLTINPEISTDFCVRNNEPYPILGTTYFVTDVYQKCFLDFNVDRCYEDLGLLKKDGFNTIRSGNWLLNKEFLGEQGEICEVARRSLYALFTCACEYDLVVQFTLGCVTLNDWDRDKCAINNPDNTKKVLNLIDNFTKLYKIFPNVMLDVVNEPSYAYGGMWTLTRPSYDSHESKAWQDWLRNKYETIQVLRNAWGEVGKEFQDFENINVPERADYSGDFCRTEKARQNTKITDFYQFARESFSKWLGQVRRVARDNAPEMIVIMGRDESLRVPCEQDEVLKNNLDMVCWHQWNRNSLIFTEYMLNRVKGKIACAQELGVYRVDKMRGGKILSDKQVADILLRKLMFGFGNWVQWEAFDDSEKVELSENMLGLYRADRSETYAVHKIRKLIEAEKEGARWTGIRDEAAFPILTVYSTSSHFSTYNPVSVEVIRKHVDVMTRTLRNQMDFMLEHLMDKAYETTIGSPALIVLPGVMRISDGCFEELIRLVEKGSTLLISGCIEENQYFCTIDRISTIDNNKIYERAVRDFEYIDINGQSFLLDFRKGCGYAETKQTLRMFWDGEDIVSIKEYNVGQGKIIYCPLPLELSSDNEALISLYKYALQASDAENKVYSVLESPLKKHIDIHAIVYERCTVYTIINDGPTSEIEVIDHRSGTRISICLESSEAVKLWLGIDGRLLNYYSDKELSIVLEENK